MLFFPDQHLGRNTGIAMGYGLDDMRVWDPRRDLGGLSEQECKESTFLLWRGHCSIHQRFRPEHIEAFRAEHPDGIVVVHPECPHETVALADQVGSTDYIIRAVADAPAGSTIAVGTEVHLTNRLAHEHPDKTVVSLDPIVCPCSTMNRIDEPHLAWVLDELVAGRVVNPIRRRPRHGRVGPGRAPAHARHHLTLNERADRSLRPGRRARGTRPGARAPAPMAARDAATEVGSGSIGAGACDSA